MLFFVILGAIAIVSVAVALFVKNKKTEDKKANVVKRVAIGMACTAFACILFLGIVVLKCQANTTDDSLEMERVYLVYKVENDEYNSSIVKRIENYNQSIIQAQKYCSNPFLGVFFTDAEVRAKPIKYEIKIID